MNANKEKEQANEGSPASDDTGGRIKDARQIAALRAEALLKKAEGASSPGDAPKPEQDGDSIRVPRGEYEQLKNQLKDWEALRDRLLRQAADFENAKKRLEREKSHAIQFAGETLIRALLPVIQNLDRVVHHSQKHEQVKNNPLVRGVELVLRQFHQVLEPCGVKRIEAVGKMFDPHLHEAVAHVDSDKPPGTVIEEVSPGYLLEAKLLQPAKVVVAREAKAPDAAADPPASGPA